MSMRVFFWVTLTRTVTLLSVSPTSTQPSARAVNISSPLGFQVLKDKLTDSVSLSLWPGSCRKDVELKKTGMELDSAQEKVRLRWIGQRNNRRSSLHVFMRRFHKITDPFVTSSGETSYLF